MPLTKGERRVLQSLADDEYCELVQAIPGGWWLSSTKEGSDFEYPGEKIGGRIGWSLIRKILISQDQYSDDSYRIYSINESGRQALADPDFISPGERIRAHAAREGNVCGLII